MVEKSKSFFSVSLQRNSIIPNNNLASTTGNDFKHNKIHKIKSFEWEKSMKEIRNFPHDDNSSVFFSLYLRFFRSNVH